MTFPYLERTEMKKLNQRVWSWWERLDTDTRHAIISALYYTDIKEFLNEKLAKFDKKRFKKEIDNY